jgi:hypothetical protein
VICDLAPIGTGLGAACRQCDHAIGAHRVSDGVCSICEVVQELRSEFLRLAVAYGRWPAGPQDPSTVSLPISPSEKAALEADYRTRNGLAEDAPLTWAWPADA